MMTSHLLTISKHSTTIPQWQVIGNHRQSTSVWSTCCRCLPHANPTSSLSSMSTQLQGITADGRQCAPRGAMWRGGLPSMTRWRWGSCWDVQPMTCVTGNGHLSWSRRNTVILYSWTLSTRIETWRSRRSALFSIWTNSVKTQGKWRTHSQF